jgi:PaaX protein central Cas2-like domain/PaaX-like protein
MAGGPSPRSSGAKALLYTILGEFVLPAGGSAWTASLVSSLGALDVTEKNARQAIARVAEQGVVRSERFGRSVRWHLTASGRHILETGAERIYHFGEPYDWEGEWLVVHCPVPETKRPLRHQVRKRLAFEGFGELAPSLAVSPHVDRESSAREILADLDLAADSILLRARPIVISSPGRGRSTRWRRATPSSSKGCGVRVPRRTKTGSARRSSSCTDGGDSLSSIPSCPVPCCLPTGPAAPPPPASASSVPPGPRAHSVGSPAASPSSRGRSTAD